MTHKIFSLSVFILCIYNVVFSQNTSKNIAPFKIQTVDGKQFTYQQLKKNKAVILVYFSPTCDHCKAFTKELLLHKKELSSRQIVMVTYVPLDEMKPFISDFNLKDYPNITVGTEGYSFIVQKYYQVKRFPFVAIYNRQLQLVKILPYSEDNTATVAEILKL